MLELQPEPDILVKREITKLEKQINKQSTNGAKSSASTHLKKCQLTDSYMSTTQFIDYLITDSKEKIQSFERIDTLSKSLDEFRSIV